MGAAVLPEVLDKTWGLLQEHGRWFAPRTLARYKEGYLSCDSNQSPLREVETSPGVALLSEWGCGLTSRRDKWDLVPFVWPDRAQSSPAQYW